MNNLDLIIEKIINDATLEANTVIAEAEKKAQAVEYEGRRTVKEKSDSLLLKASQNCEERIAKAESSAHMAERNAVLSAKLEILDSVFSKAEEALCALERSKYIALMLRFLEESLEKSDGVLLLNRKDRDSVGDDFLKRANEISARLEKGTLSLSPDSADIDGGFILKYGDIEINCSTASMIASFRSKEEKKIYDKIFA